MDENCFEDGKGEVGWNGVGAWEFQNWEQCKGYCFFASLFASLLQISKLKGILSKQHQQNEIHQVYFSKCLHFPMLLFPGDTLLLWPTVKSQGHFLLDGVQVCYLEWKKEKGTMKERQQLYLQTSFQNSCVPAESYWYMGWCRLAQLSETETPRKIQLW